MKLTNQEILEIERALQVLMVKPFPIMVSYKLGKIGGILRGQFRLLHEVQNGLLRKHGGGYRTAEGQWGVPLFVDEKDEQGKVIKQRYNPAADLYQEEWAELLKEEVEFDGFKGEKVKLPENIASTCDKCHHNMPKAFEIEGSILMALDRFIEV